MAIRVLVVDDAAFMRMMVKDILSKNGYEVVGEAENGLKAVEKWQELKPDLTTMDITMPEMDGIEATRSIRQSLEIQPIIIAMTANAMNEDKEDCLQAGMDDFISKPVKLDDLLAMLIKWGTVANENNADKNITLRA